MTESTPNDPSTKEKDDRMQDWWRIAPMIFFALISYFVLWLLFIGALLQYISVAAQGEKAEQISGFNRSIRRYLIDIFDYLTYKRDAMPFPFGEFPSTASEARQAAEPRPGPAPTAPAAATVVTPTAPAPEPPPAPESKPAAATGPKPRARTKPPVSPATTANGVAKRAAAKPAKPKPKSTPAKAPPADTDEG